MKKFNFIGLMVVVIFLLSACSSNNKPTEPTNQKPTVTEEAVDKTEEDLEENELPENVKEESKISIVTLKGPTGMGMAKMMDANEKNETQASYEFSIVNSPDEAVAEFVNGSAKIAAVPTNLAATLYNKGNANMNMLAINTLGTLYILENGESIKSIKDLEGKTIYATGQGAVPEYVLNHILKKNEINDVKIEWKSEHSELATLLASGEAMVAMLPEPFVEVVLNKNSDLKKSIDITEEWGKLYPDKPLPMGCIVVDKDFADQNPVAIMSFMQDYLGSVDYVNQNEKEAGELIAKYGIIENAAIASKAIKPSNIVYIDNMPANEGDMTMQEILGNFYSILKEEKPESIGGEIPDEGFYYKP